MNEQSSVEYKIRKYESKLRNTTSKNDSYYYKQKLAKYNGELNQQGGRQASVQDLSDFLKQEDEDSRNLLFNLSVM